ncbi:MAG: hypothetical protein LC792_19400 [Actinobacteria bacterium]|nr:hypothetical protein [Actinomycetota bacterium]
MPEHRSNFPHLFRSLVSGRRRWVIGGIGALAVSGLVLSGLAGPASADDLPNNVGIEQSADVSATATPDPVVTPDPKPTVDPSVDEVPTSSTTTTKKPERCASSRTKPQCGGDDNPGVDPEVEGTDATTTTTTTTAAPAVDPVNTVAGGGDPGAPAPEVVLAGVEEQPAPAAAPAPAATLPRTGVSSHLGTEVTLAFGLLGAGIALLLFRRRRPAGQRQEG